MAHFIGTKDEFIKYIGGYCRNKVNAITRNERLLHNKICQHCKKTNTELESAHVSGQERNVIIEGILKQFFKIHDNYYNVDLNKFEEGTEVTPELLFEMGIIKKQLSGIKVLGNGELTKKLTVRAHKFSSIAKEKIEAAGGKAEVI